MGDVLIGLCIVASWVLCYWLGWDDRKLYEEELKIERRMDRLVAAMQEARDD